MNLVPSTSTLALRGMLPATDLLGRQIEVISQARLREHVMAIAVPL
jgi:hypothetical protein